MSTICIKVKNLREHGYSDLREWMDDEDNVYVGRRGRIFIHTNGKKEIFHYKGSKWQNPFKLKDYSLEESLEKFEEYIRNSDIIDDISELEGKTLGCFCDQSKGCHAKILVKLLNENN